MAGYSSTPLLRKLGIKEGFRVAFVNSPKNFKKELGPLPADVKLFVSNLTKPLDLIVLFVDKESMLRGTFPVLAEKLTANGMLWIAWPKKNSKVATDLAFGDVQRIGLDAGLVDVKICAVNEIWSALKFVYRLRDRKLR
ncbi:MAG: DUF3052 domain-containing protein [Pyrinomonadaceae bacterium]|nr:DUF3052 domain-containing protein [Pyrinomonadaceae bacterium]